MSPVPVHRLAAEPVHTVRHARGRGRIRDRMELRYGAQRGSHGPCGNVNAIYNELGFKRMREGGTRKTRRPVMQRRHGIEEMGDTDRAVFEPRPAHVVVARRMPELHTHPAPLQKRCQVSGWIGLRRQGHHPDGRTREPLGHQRQVARDRERRLRPEPVGRDEWSFEMHAENGGSPSLRFRHRDSHRVERRRDLRDRRRHRGGQEPRRAVSGVGLRGHQHGIARVHHVPATPAVAMSIDEAWHNVAPAGMGWADRGNPPGFKVDPGRVATLRRTQSTLRSSAC